MLGAVLSLVWVGLPLLAGVARLAWQLAEGERRQANRLLDAHLPPVPRPPRRALGDWRETLESPGARLFWRVLAMLLLRLPVAVAALALAAAPVVLAAVLLVLGVRGPRRRAATGSSARGRSGPPRGRAVRARAARRGRGGRRARTASAGCCGRLAQALLRTDAAGAGAGARDAGRAARRPLAEHRVLAARPRDLRRRARPSRRRCPAPGSGRAWTAVEREGNRVAAIVHDAELDATPSSSTPPRRPPSLALDNERLKADLRARLEELRHSRRRIVEAADDARRQIERDLHDGAQQQLVSLALDLRLLRARLRATTRRRRPRSRSSATSCDRAGRAARARARHPSRGALRPRPGARHPRARRARPDAGRVRPGVRRPARSAGRGGRLLRRRRGADQRRQVRATPRRRR